MSRQAFVVGFIAPKALARFCGWCGDPLDDRAERLREAGARITTGLCPNCAADLDEQIEALPRPVFG